jgi:YfiH family protein
MSTTRQGGVSAGPFASLNLAERVGDHAAAVAENRRRLAARAAMPTEPAWLRQVHGVAVTEAGLETGSPVAADASFVRRPGPVCAVLTADCLPVLFASRRGTVVAAAHAGWRGLAAGVLEAVIDRLGEPSSDLLAWLGPAIGPNSFEIGPEVRDRFMDLDPGCAVCFRPGRDDRWFADLAELARRRLRAAGLMSIHGGGLCTYADRERFFSYRRDGECGRMASLIWLERSPAS